MTKNRAWREYWEQNALYHDPIMANDFPTIPVRKYRRMMSEVAVALRLEKGDVLLNMGCGTGQFERFTYNRVEKAVGLDFSANMVQQAKWLNRDLAAVRFVQGDCTELPFRDGMFTKVLAFSMTHYLTETQLRSMLYESMRVLKPGGLLLIGDIQEPGFEDASLKDKVSRIWREEGVKMLLIRFSLKVVDPFRKRMERVKLRRLVEKGRYFDFEKPENLRCYSSQKMLQNLPGSVGTTEVLPQDSVRFYPKRYNLLVTKGSMHINSA